MPKVKVEQPEKLSDMQTPKRALELHQIAISWIKPFLLGECQAGKVVEELYSSGNLNPRDRIYIVGVMMHFCSTPQALLLLEAISKELGGEEEFVPPMNIHLAVNHVLLQVPLNDFRFAHQKTKEGVEGFAALHEKCDANMLLPLADDDSYHGEEYRTERTAWWSTVIEAVSKRIKEWSGDTHNCPDCGKPFPWDSTRNAHFMSKDCTRFKP